MRLHVLVVEDDQDKRAAVVRVLQSSGLDVDSLVLVNDVRSARRALGNSRFDLMILDIMLPEDPAGNPTRSAGLALLDQVLKDDRLLAPRQIVGLSGVEEVVEEAQSKFSTVGCLFLRYSSADTSWRAPLRCVVENIRRTLIPGEEGYRSLAFLLCALREPELSAILHNRWSWNPLVAHGDDTEYYRAELPNGHEVFAAAASRMGTEASAILAVKAIQHFRPRFLIMPGIAAGVAGRAELGDILVGDPVWNWGSGKWKSQGGTRSFAPAPHMLPLNSGVRKTLQQLADDHQLLATIKAGWQGAPVPTALRIHLGPLASGPAVLADSVGVERIQAQHRKLNGVEMEAYGVCLACFDVTKHRPTPIVLKSVVDYADADKSDDCQHYGAYTSASVATEVVERLLAAGV